MPMLTIDRAREVLMADPEIRGAFAEYKHAPAIWMRDQAPFDTDSFWTQPDEDQYPRADLAITTQYLPERQVEGQFTVGLLAKSTEVDAMLRRIIDILDGAVLNSDEGRDGLMWGGTPQGDVHDEILYFAVVFNLARILTGTTFPPDPVAVLNQWSRTTFEDALVDPESWLPLRDSLPAIYWRTLGEESAPPHFRGMTEYRGRFVCHVIHQDPLVRARMVRKIVIALGRVPNWRIAIPGMRPFLRLDENGIAYDSNRDPMRAGQVLLSSVMYGISDPAVSIPRLENIISDITAN